ncbi:MAG: response regulator transcription factor [Chthoniobacterales bacterium]|nr:response regulator transcription factor [Chthoniobacterales bacterium]
MSKISPDRPAKGCVRLLVVDVTAISREGIRAIVRRDGRFELSEYVHGSAGAMDLVGQHRPDLLLIEPFAEGRDGVLLIKDLKARFPGLRISRHLAEIGRDLCRANLARRRLRLLDEKRPE